jgi:hypothetical protein
VSSTGDLKVGKGGGKSEKRKRKGKGGSETAKPAKERERRRICLRSIWRKTTMTVMGKT